MTLADTPPLLPEDLAGSTDRLPRPQNDRCKSCTREVHNRCFARSLCILHLQARPAASTTQPRPSRSGPCLWCNETEMATDQAGPDREITGETQRSRSAVQSRRDSFLSSPRRPFRRQELHWHPLDCLESFQLPPHSHLQNPRARSAKGFSTPGGNSSGFAARSSAVLKSKSFFNFKSAIFSMPLALTGLSWLER